MEKVYSFTNENVSSYSDIYNMNGANMLTILGSGDQYFTALFLASCNALNALLTANCPLVSSKYISFAIVNALL